MVEEELNKALDNLVNPLALPPQVILPPIVQPMIMPVETVEPVITVEYEPETPIPVIEETNTESEEVVERIVETPEPTIVESTK